MARNTQGHRDSKALAFAALATLVLGLTSEPIFESAPGSLAFDGLLDAQTAQTAGAWMLDDPAATARLSFAPDHGLVWRVGTGEQQVLLDAATGEALAFEFD